MKTITCDNCGSAIPAAVIDAAIDWVVVGWHHATPEDACSEKCAQSILKRMRREREEMDAILETEAANA